jgi:hypothetical protein
MLLSHWCRTGERYKWQLYGDDDTLFFPSGVLRMMQHFDPLTPLFLSDNLWWSAGGTSHPNVHAPRCLPCHHMLSQGQCRYSYQSQTIRCAFLLLPLSVANCIPRGQPFWHLKLCWNIPVFAMSKTCILDCLIQRKLPAHQACIGTVISF